MLIMQKKSILILGKGPIQELDDATLIAETEYFIVFSLIVHYNDNNSFLSVNGVNLYQFRAKDRD